MRRRSEKPSIKVLKIDGVDVGAREDETILQLAQENDIFIPTLCHMEGLSDVGGCRLCIVEIEGSNKLHPACMTYAREGMIVHTTSERIDAYRRMIIDMLFSERNHVCSVCVSNGHCDLQYMATRLGVTHIRVPYLYPRLPIDASHRFFTLDHDRCILCTRCVRVCDEIEGAHTWDVMGRGTNSRHHRRPEPALGRLGKLHGLRQMRAGVPDRGAVPEGARGGRTDEKAGIPALPAVDAGR